MPQQLHCLESVQRLSNQHSVAAGNAERPERERLGIDSGLKPLGSFGFDPDAVAHAELAWWVARRVPGQNSPEHVGSLIAEEYALLYETTPGAVAQAARLRAEAGALRDEQARSPDWDAIGQLLQRSYRELLAALSVINV